MNALQRAQAGAIGVFGWVAMIRAHGAPADDGAAVFVFAIGAMMLTSATVALIGWGRHD